MLSRTLSVILVLLLYSAVTNAVASDKSRCDDRLLARVGKHFNLKHFAYPADGMYPSVENGGLIVAGVCKQWPFDKSKVIAAFAYDSGGGTNENDPFNELLIAIIDQQKNKVVGSHKEKYYLEPGGIGYLRIDTARYDVAPNLRAFGLDIKSGYSHNCGDGGAGEERTLYVQDKDSLRPILHLPYMSSWTYIKSADNRCGADSDVEIIENVNYSIEPGINEANGYRDLIITANSSRTDGKPTGKDKFSYTLSYDGNKYPTEAMRKALEKWDFRIRQP